MAASKPSETIADLFEKGRTCFREPNGIAAVEAFNAVIEQDPAYRHPDGDTPWFYLGKIHEVCHMEWESDKLSRRFARRLYRVPGVDPVEMIIVDKLTHALGRLADHAEHVGKNLRLMITRK